MLEHLRIRGGKAVALAGWYPALGVGVALACVVDAASLHRTPSATAFLLAAAGGVGVMLCGLRPLLAAGAIGLAFVASALLEVADGAPDVSFLAPAIGAYAVAAHAGREWAAAGLMVILGSLEVRAIPTGNWVPWVYAGLAPWVVGRFVASRRRLVCRLEARARELDDERDAFTALAVRRERTQIARDLHDIVSHNMAVVVVQAGAGRIAPSENPEQVADSFQSIRAAADAALVEMDQLVDVLDDKSATREPGMTLAAIPSLVQLARVAGLDVCAEISTAPGDLPFAIEQAAYRAIQEGLTNVIKHAPGSHVALRVTVHDTHLEIAVFNRGATTGGELADTGSATGLAGLQERVLAHGGELSAGPAPGGWCLDVRLPIHRTA